MSQEEEEKEISLDPPSPGDLYYPSELSMNSFSSGHYQIPKIKDICALAPGVNDLNKLRGNVQWTSAVPCPVMILEVRRFSNNPLPGPLLGNPDGGFGPRRVIYLHGDVMCCELLGVFLKYYSKDEEELTNDYEK